MTLLFCTILYAIALMAQKNEDRILIGCLDNTRLRIIIVGMILDLIVLLQQEDLRIAVGISLIAGAAVMILTTNKIIHIKDQLRYNSNKLKYNKRGNIR